MASPSPRSSNFLPLAQRFRDMHEPVRAQVMEATAKIIRDNVKELYDCNVIHWLGGARGGRRCRDCIVEFARAVDVAERSGLAVEESHRRFLVDQLLQLHACRDKQQMGDVMMGLLDAVVVDAFGTEEGTSAAAARAPCKLRTKQQREKALKEEIEREMRRQSHLSVRNSVLEQQEEEEEDEDDGELVWESDTGEELD